MSMTEFNAASGQQAEASADDASIVPGTSFGAIALGLIVTSTTNTRTSHNPAKLRELLANRVAAKTIRSLLADFTTESPKQLAEIVGTLKLAEFVHSIYVQGVNQPILLRPLPAARLADTQPEHTGAKRPEYEIVAGERRYYGSLLCGKTTIPAMVKTLTDQEALEFQLVENLQRDDLHPMEEAEGYERLCRDTGTPKEEIGAKIGKSRSYVYGRLKLLDLCQDARKAFYAEQLDASKALLVARIPDEKLQLKALKEFTSGYGLTMSVRACLDWLQRNVMLRLDKAPFKITSDTLLPAAGSCRACPKRTGASPELFADVDSADVCTDPKCYDRKLAAHEELLRTEAEAKGLTVITGKQAHELRPNSYVQEVRGFLDLDEPVPGKDSDKPLRKILGKDAPQPVVFIDPHTHQVRHLVPLDVAGDALKAKGIAAVRQSRPGAESRARDEAARRKANIENEIEVTWRARAAAEIMGAVRAGNVCAFSAPMLRAILLELAENENECYGETCFEHLLPLWGLPTDVNDEFQAVQAHVRAAPDTELGPMLLAYMLAREVEYRRWKPDAKETPSIQQLATETGIDIAPLQAQAKTEVRASAAAALKKEKAEADAKAQKKGKKAAGTSSSAAQAQGESEGNKAAGGAKKGRGKASARPSVEEVQSGIADAMRNLEPASGTGFVVGQRVRFKQDLKINARRMLKVNGGEGTIVKAVGDRAFSVQYGKSQQVATADYTELQAVDVAEEPKAEEEVA